MGMSISALSVISMGMALHNNAYPYDMSDFKLPKYSRGKNLTNGRRVEVKNEVKRNDPCPCGSGKKAKNCCGVVKEYEDVTKIHK